VDAAQTGYEKQVEAARSHTASYATDPRFRNYWLGFTRPSRNYRGQIVRAFGELVGSVTDTLQGWRVLDVGCGNGQWLRAMLEYDANPEDLVGVDISDARFETARRRNPLITLMQTDGSSLPFADDCFDLACLFVCFSNVPTVALRQRVAAEMCRVVRPGKFVFWWDLKRTTAPADFNARLHPADYFDWPIKQLAVGEWPRLGECLPVGDWGRRLLRPLLAPFGCRATHVAALIGPKP
jgi:SAM-dependent methyltransferase